MESIASAHGYVLGFAVIGAWATIMFWALALRFTSYEETPTFWRAVSVGQILLGLQLLVGLVLVAWWLFGNGPAPGANSAGEDGGIAFNATFHLLYGVGFPIVVLLMGHRYAREGRYNPHTVFAVVGLVIFGLTVRAWQVGAGVGS